MVRLFLLFLHSTSCETNDSNQSTNLNILPNFITVRFLCLVACCLLFIFDSDACRMEISLLTRSPFTSLSPHLFCLRFVILLYNQSYSLLILLTL